MLDVRTNFAGGLKDLDCPLCQLEEDRQEHLMDCSRLNAESEIVAAMPKYKELFGPPLNEKFLYQG